MRTVPDPYLPGHGDTRYRVRSYQLELDYKVATNRLSGRATLDIEALEHLEAVRLDLHRLSVERVRVDGARPAKVTAREESVVVRLAAPVPAGGTARVEVAYGGKPTPVHGVHGPAGWEELTDGALVASQPYGAPSFFPCNDRADDKAAYAIAVTADANYHVAATGRPTGAKTGAGRTRWTFEQTAPTSTYLVSVAIGRLRPQSLPGAGGRITVVHPRQAAVRPQSPFLRLPAMLGALEEWFGPYPLDGFAAVVVDDTLEIPLESQGMATFGTNHLGEGWENERLVVHELAHQWFGNAVTASRLRDIWLHEGFACYTEWLWSDRRGLGTADQRAAEHWNALKGVLSPGPLSDPGMDHMFDDWVYKRGALTLHALRTSIGSEAFFSLLREWVASHRGGTASTADFTALAAHHTSDDLAPLFSEWLDGRALPALTGRG